MEIFILLKTQIKIQIQLKNANEHYKYENKSTVLKEENSSDLDSIAFNQKNLSRFLVPFNSISPTKNFDKHLQAKT